MCDGYDVETADALKDVYGDKIGGSRKFALEYITRDDIAALTKEAAEISGIDYVMDADKEEVDGILSS